MQFMVGADGAWEIDFGEEIKRGVALLEDHDPRWFDYINLDELALESASQCVLGQLAMGMLREKIESSDRSLDYYGAIAYLYDTEQTDSEGERYGFTVSVTTLHSELRRLGIDAPHPLIYSPGEAQQVDTFYKQVWEMLTLQWAEQIEKCRAEAGTMVEGAQL